MSSFVGHSLGGALATLAAYDIQAEFSLRQHQVALPCAYSVRLSCACICLSCFASAIAEHVICDGSTRTDAFEYILESIKTWLH